MVPDRRWVRDSNMAEHGSAENGARSIARPPTGAAASSTARDARYATLRAMTIVLIAVALYLLAAGLLVRAVARTRSTRAAAGCGRRSAASRCMPPYHAAGGLARRRAARTCISSPRCRWSALGMAALTTLVGAQRAHGGAGRGRRSRSRPLLLLVYHAARPRARAARWTGACSCMPGWRCSPTPTLAIAALLALMLWAQERALRRREFHGWLRALPPLTELEDAAVPHRSRSASCC